MKIIYLFVLIFNMSFLFADPKSEFLEKLAMAEKGDAESQHIGKLVPGEMVFVRVKTLNLYRSFLWNLKDFCL